MTAPVKQHYFSQHAGPLRTELSRALSREQLQALHRKSGPRHLLIAARQFAILALATAGLIIWSNPLVWVPLAVVQGFTVFNFTVLLHEVVHNTVFARARPRAERLLAWCYAVPSGISSSQFTRWHLDHHAELGSTEDDPKRHHLSPKINARWFKLLYASPALFPIYFRAANGRFVAGTIDGAGVAAELARWSSWQWLRVSMGIGALIASAPIFPSSSGNTVPSARVAPVVVGIKLIAAARARRRSLCGASRTGWVAV